MNCTNNKVNEQSINTLNDVLQGRLIPLHKLIQPSIDTLLGITDPN